MTRKNKYWLGVLSVMAAGLLLLVFSAFGANGPEPAPPKPCEGPATTITVQSSPEKFDVMTSLAAAYSAAHRPAGTTCGAARIVASVGSTVPGFACGWDEARFGARPDVWSPATRTWLVVAQNLHETQCAQNQTLLPPAADRQAPSLAQTPMVIAMPRPMAEAMGWPNADVGWNDVLQLAQSPDGWKLKGHPEWGAFKLGKTNPNYSTTGLHATIGAFFAATGSTSDLTQDDLNDERVADFMREVERSVVHYGETTLTFLRNLYDAGRVPGANGLDYISAVTVEEKSVIDYNRGYPEGKIEGAGTGGPPAVPLAAFYPKEGTVVSENPYVVLNASWVDAAKRDVANDFLAYLLAPEQQAAFAEAGFRSPHGTPGPALAASAGVLPDKGLNVLNMPAGDVLARIPEAWGRIRKAANVLFVVDVSGSMRNADKLPLAQQAARSEAALGTFRADDRLGLWEFSGPRGGDSRPWRELVPLGEFATTRQPYADRIGGLTADGPTALFNTVQAANEAMRKHLDPGRINAIVLLSDGEDEYVGDNIGLDRLLADLTSGGADQQIRVFPIAYGDEARPAVDQLRRIAAATRAKLYHSTDPRSISKVFSDVLSNF
ncbi:substrate-binding and VWA domain-containing protein [Amycolatopsis anabasis]|uniref:substrate-binding and VWA domain-containing protein n=1 Tax=Amycolatopsis anabasis TaxID=1840409 RepID=UPI00131ABC39|nr:substrate-binding and VWA domain-containing protein [Amycolatopsis anabasis]